MSTTLVDQAVQPTSATAAKVRIGIVGVNFGSNIIHNLARGNDFTELVGICDLNKDKAEQLAAQVGVPAFSSLDEMLADGSVEAIGLFTPPHGRAALVSRILKSGRHVMTTKPFESSLAAATEVLDEARQLSLAVHMNSPAAVATEDIRQIIAWTREFDLGQAVGMRAETWAHYREKADGSWYDDPKRCPVAPIFRLGIYFLNDFAALLGNPVRVFAMQSRIFTQRPTADNAQVAIAYDNGAIANIFASFCVQDGKPYADMVKLNYERGTIRRWIERKGGKDMSDDIAVMELQTAGGDIQRFTTKPGGYAGWYDWETFQRAIRSRDPQLLQNRKAVLEGVRLVEAMSRSADSGLPESV